jgi:DNA-binding Lrp family transcriptional regulator
MNDTDQKLINLLRHNGRRSISDLAIDLGVSRATVKARMERLEQSRQIVGYTAILKSDEDDNAIRGIMLIEVAGQATNRVVQNLETLPEVSAIHSTNGRWDLIAELRTESLGAFDKVLNRIRLIQGITNSETHLQLATLRENKATMR